MCNRWKFAHLPGNLTEFTACETAEADRQIWQNWARSFFIPRRIGQVCSPTSGCRGRSENWPARR